MISADFISQPQLEKDPKYKIPAFSVQHPESTYISIDQALYYTGDNSKYSKRVLYILCVLWIIHSMLTMGFNQFFSGNEYYCTNIFDQRYKCSMQEACTQNSGDIDKVIIEGVHNIVYEFQLYCDNKIYADWAGTFYFVGLMLGTICFQPLADSRGRRVALITSCLLTGVCLILCGLSNRFELWLLSVCLAGCGLGGQETISLVYVTEISATNFRNNSQAAQVSVWAGAQIIMGIVYNFVDSWRNMFQYVMGAPFVVCTIFVIFFMDETPRYLASKQKFEEAKYVLAKISRTNRRPPFKFKLNGEVTDDNSKFFITLKDGNVSVGNSSYLDGSYMSHKANSKNKALNTSNQRLGLLKSKDQRIKTIILFLIWGIRFFVYFGIQFLTDAFSGQENMIFLNFTFLGMSELFASAISAKIKRKFSRKRSLTFSFIVTGVAQLCVYFDFYTIYAGICAKAGVTIFYAILITYTAELYPTELRAQAYAYLIFSGRLAMIIMPFVLGYFKNSLINPPLVLSCLMFISIPLVKALKETHNSDMTELENGALGNNGFADPKSIYNVENISRCNDSMVDQNMSKQNLNISGIRKKKKDKNLNNSNLKNSNQFEELIDSENRKNKKKSNFNKK